MKTFRVTNMSTGEQKDWVAEDFDDLVDTWNRTRPHHPYFNTPITIERVIEQQS